MRYLLACRILLYSTDRWGLKLGVPALQRISLFAATLSLSAQPRPVEYRAIELARRVSVSTLEAGIPRETLVHWLTRAAGPSAKITWEVTDCGEQTGNPETDRGRDFPLCVDAIAALPGGS